MKKRFVLPLFFLVASAAFAESPECSYWKTHINELNEQIQKTETKLKECRANAPNDCHDLEMTLKALQDEKDGTEKFIKPFCSNE